MREIQLKDAKASLSAVVDAALRGEASIITRHGKPQAVILSYADWERLSRVPSFGQLLGSAPIEAGDLPERDATPVRELEISDRVYLLDTNVISAVAPAKFTASIDVGRWINEHSAVLYLSVVTVTEIAAGIAKAHRNGAHRKAANLAAWLDMLLHLYQDRVLVFDSAIARQAGTLSDLARGRGWAPGFADAAIAATAHRHGLTVLTRNVSHFVPFDVPVIDPFEELPPGR